MDKQIRAEQAANITALDDDDLKRELSYAEGFGPYTEDQEIEQSWLGLCRAEKQRREEMESTR